MKELADEIVKLFAKYGITITPQAEQSAIDGATTIALGKAKEWLAIAQHKLASLQDKEKVAKLFHGKLVLDAVILAEEAWIAILQEEITILSK